MTDITALTNALNFLTEQEDYVKVRDQVRVMADMPNTAFVDDFVALNPLLVYARERGGAAALAPLLRVADQAVGEETADKLRRRHYQHGYMRVRRARENKAARAKWLTLPEHVRAKHPKGLRGAVRKDFISYVNARWQAGKDEALADITDPNDRDIAFDRYWREIDSLLDRAVDGDRLAAKKVLGDYVLPIPPIH
ncbi:MAG: hypothetical protein NHG36_01550 [Chromatiaceae bacterium]|nr:hypothetical protein [Candidatus Thioaporhodococcus sediminis]